MKTTLQATVAALALGVSALAIAPATAATVTEAVVGDFSDSWTAPTLISGTAVAGALGGSDRLDVFSFHGLDPAAAFFDLTLQLLSFGDSYTSSGIAIHYAFTPFAGQNYSFYPGTWISAPVYHTQAHVAFDPWNPAEDGTRAFRFDLGSGFAGDLHVALGLTNGTATGYRLSVDTPASGSPTVVPLPASAALMLSALGVLGGAALLRRRRKAA